MELANRSRTGRCEHCGGRLLVSVGNSRDRITTCQMCGRSPFTRAPEPDEKRTNAGFGTDREIAREKDRAYRRKRNQARAAI